MNATAGNETAGYETMEEGLDWTRIDMPLKAEDHWNASFDQEGLLKIIHSFNQKGLAYEAFAYYFLFFGDYGVLNETAPIIEMGTLNETETAVAAPVEGEAAAAPAEGGFL